MNHEGAKEAKEERKKGRIGIGIGLTTSICAKWGCSP
jgi:hypothetical protein